MAANRAPLRAVQLGLALTVEAGWLLAWDAVLGGWIEPRRAAPLFGLPAIAALLAAATLATRLALGGRARPGRARAAVALLGLGLAALAAATVLQPAGWPAGRTELGSPGDSGAGGWHAVGAATLVLLAWWRGIVAGRARPSVDSAEAGLRLAVGALAILFLIQAFAPRDERTIGTLAGAALLVLAAGLLALPLAALLDQHDGWRLEGAGAPRIGAPWLGLLIGAVAALLLLASFLAQALTFERLDLLLQPLGTALGALTWALVYAVGILVGFWVELVIWLLAPLVLPLERRYRGRLADLSFLDELREQGNRPVPLDGPLFTILGLIGGAAVAGLLAWLLARAVVRWADSRPDDGVEEHRDFVWSRDGLWNSLRRRLRALRPRQHRPQAAEPPPIATEEPPGGTVRGVRELYRNLLRLGVRLGRRRAASETPREYERALAALGPLAAGRADVRRLTEAYAEARYSAAPPSPRTVAEARAALVRLEALAGAAAAPWAYGTEEETPGASRGGCLPRGPGRASG